MELTSEQWEELLMRQYIQLHRDYQRTIDSTQQAQESMQGVDPPVQAEWVDQPPQYVLDAFQEQQDEDEEGWIDAQQEQSVEIVHQQPNQPVSVSRTIPMDDDKIEFIKECMQGLDFKAPSWASSISDSQWQELVTRATQQE